MKFEEMDFQNLLTKFFAGEISDSEMILLKNWLDSNPENRRIFNEENEFWQEAGIWTKLENYKTDTAWTNMASRLGLGKNHYNSVTVLSRSNCRILLAAAAVACIVAIGSLSLWITGKTSFQKIAASSTVFSTNEGEKAHVCLADSTEIFINSGSTIQYDGDFNLKDRIVKFSGEAFFNVNTNPEKPFVVQVEKMSITATGTRFNVLSFSDEDRIETTLEEGTIHVSANGKDPVTLKSGQQIVYFRRSEKYLVRDVETDTYTSWKENKLRFNDTPFEEVLRRIGRKYNVNFQITDKELLNLKYTATFIDEPIEDVMMMLRTVSPITYSIQYLTSVSDVKYMKPKIIVKKRKSL
jgi:transmembrane sensor